MGIYIVLFFIILIMFVIENSYLTIKLGTIRIDSRKLAFEVIALSIILVGVSKSQEYGYDAESYRINYFEYVQDKSVLEVLKSGIEPGFALLTLILHKISSSYWLYRAFMFLFSFGGISFVIWRKSKNISLSYLLYISFGMFSFNMCIFRQAIAVSVVLLGINNLEEKKYLKFSMFILLASLFHYTAMFVFLLLPLTYWRFDSIRLAIRFIYSITFFLLGKFFLKYLIDLYSINDYSDYIVEGEGIGYLFVIVLLILAFEFFKHYFLDNLFWDINLYDDKEWICSDTIYEFSLGCIYIQIIALFFSLFNRVIYYPFAFAMICLPNNVPRNKGKNNRLILSMIVILCFIMYYKTILNSTDLIPYVFEFEL